MLHTDTGMEFVSPDEALNFLREAHKKMLDSGVSHAESMRATTDALYTFKALDAHLCEGGDLPRDWQAWLSHVRSRDLLDTL